MASPEHAWPPGRLARALMAAGDHRGTPRQVERVTGLGWRTARYLCRTYGLPDARLVRLLALEDAPEAGEVAAARDPYWIGPAAVAQYEFAWGLELEV